MTPPIAETEHPNTVLETEATDNKPSNPMFTTEQIEKLLDIAPLKSMMRDLEDLDVAPPQTAMSPLSVAMLEGIKLCPLQVKKHLFDHQGVGACAIGAVYAYADRNIYSQMRPRPQASDSIKIDYLCRVYPQLNHKVASPINGSMDSVLHHVMHLNDNCDWSRTRIANWLGSIGL